MNNCTVLLVTIGHTAAGKTTLSKEICKKLNIIHIAEGQIKREIRGDYSTSDSLDEKLRDIAYEKAIGIAKTYIDNEKSVLIDASFHKIQRRELVYRMLQESSNSAYLVLLYCYCPEISKIEKRISERKMAIKTAETQADSMDIYYHITKTFDLPSIDEIPDSINAAIIYVNTDTNRIDDIKYTANNDSLTLICEQLCELIVDLLKEKT